MKTHSSHSTLPGGDWPGGGVTFVRVFNRLSSHLSYVDRMSSLFRACPASRVTLVKELASAPEAAAVGR